MLIISAPKLPCISSSLEVASTTLEIPLNKFFSLLKDIIIRNWEKRDTCSINKENNNTDLVYILSSLLRVPSKYLLKYAIRSLIAGISTTLRNSSSNPKIRNNLAYASLWRTSLSANVIPTSPISVIGILLYISAQKVFTFTSIWAIANIVFLITSLSASFIPTLKSLISVVKLYSVSIQYECRIASL